MFTLLLLPGSEICDLFFNMPFICNLITCQQNGAFVNQKVDAYGRNPMQCVFSC